jgi:C1A family cysteine protease
VISRKVKRYGWKPQLPDHRDLKLSWTIPITAPLPPLTDLRGGCPPVYDQGDLGSCTANAIAGAFEFELLRSKMLDIMPSRLFIYYNERVIEGDTQQDNGAQIRDGMKSIATQGVCGELDWPYDITKFAWTPTIQCYQFALLNKSIQYLSLSQDANDLKRCLSEGFPFVFGFTVYESFESHLVAQCGFLPMPSTNEQVIGGHAVICVGYDDSKQAFLVRNSWGSGWGLGGYFWMPYDYMTNGDLADDFWTIRSVA